MAKKQMTKPPKAETKKAIKPRKKKEMPRRGGPGGLFFRHKAK
jgi:hypothetical protein